MKTTTEINPHNAANPDPAPGNYYVSATEDNLRTYHLLLGPFSSHAEALGWVDKVRAYCVKHGPAKAAFMAYGTLKMAEDCTKPGTANKYLLAEGRAA